METFELVMSIIGMIIASSIGIGFATAISLMCVIMIQEIKKN